MKSRKKDNRSYAQKKEAFWKSVLTQKLSDLRGGLVNTGMEAHTRNEEGLTSIMLAALNGKAKSLDAILDWYERRREQRRKGWINIRDDNGRTALMMACASGNVQMVDSLLFKGAKLEMKDDNQMTARDHAVKKNKHEVVKAIDEWLRESEDEVEDADGNVINDGLTSTQRNKLKKRQLQALERRGNKEKKNTAKSDDPDDDDGSPGPAPKWAEIANVVESVKMLRPVYEISIQRTEPDSSFASTGGVDPALWYLRTINRLEMKLAPGLLTSIPGQELKRLKNLSVVILNDNALASLPDEIGRLSQLKVLEVARNKLTSLPETLSKCSSLERVDASFNELTSLSSLDGLKNLGNINVCGNKLTELDLDYASLGRLHDLIISDNKISVVPAEFGLLASLGNFTGENNDITELPCEITQLKKVKTLKLDGNPIKDQKVVKMLKNDARKDLWKYLQKQGGRKGGTKGGTKGGKGKKKEPVRPPTPPPVEEDDEEDEEYFTDDSFDITMEEL